jgi:hypothetical protein
VSNRRGAWPYGPAHRAQRKLLEPLVAAGVVTCVRCGELIERGQKWDLGHVDGQPWRYAGPEHARCNQATAAHRAERRVSRDWLG